FPATVPGRCQLKREQRSEDCDAWLTIGNKTYEGSTGKNRGHAEMTALSYFVEEYDTVDQAVAAFESRLNKKRVVFCPSRSCCKKCTRTLQLLKFTLGSCSAGNSKWSNVLMGSTEWGCSMKVKDFLGKMGLDYEAIKAADYTNDLTKP